MPTTQDRDPSPARGRSSSFILNNGAATASDRAVATNARIGNGHPTVDTHGSTSAAAHALSTISSRNVSAVQTKRPRLVSQHTRGSSWPSPPPPVRTEPAPTSNTAEPTKLTFDDTDVDPLFPSAESKRLILYTYKPSSTSIAVSQPSPLPSKSTFTNIAPSTVLLCHAALPWKVRVGDYIEIRAIPKDAEQLGNGMGLVPAPSDEVKGGEALRGLKKGHDGFVCRIGEDYLHIPTNQIHVPESVASAFEFKLRSEVDIFPVTDTRTAEIDYVELRFSQYLGRGDMWRLGMSLENSTVHVGERITLCGGAVRAEIYGIWRGTHKYASGIFTSKTKTIYRSRSAQVYIFIQLCQEIWEFDEDGERYSEKVVHGG